MESSFWNALTPFYPLGTKICASLTVMLTVTQSSHCSYVFILEKFIPITITFDVYCWIGSYYHIHTRTQNRIILYCMLWASIERQNQFKCFHSNKYQKLSRTESWHWMLCQILTFWESSRILVILNCILLKLLCGCCTRPNGDKLTCIMRDLTHRVTMSFLGRVMVEK